MNLFQRSVPVLAALGLVTAGVLTSPADAARPVDGPSERGAAALPTCETVVAGQLPSGRFLSRWTKNSQIMGERKSAPLSYRVESHYTYFFENTDSGSISHSIVHTPGQPAKLVDLVYTDGSTVLTTKIVGRYRPTPKARTWANSGRFYSYAITPNGHLTRFTRFQDPDTGQQWMANPKTVLAGQGGIRALSYMTTTTTPGGVKKDVLYATTAGGALKQFQVPWNTPGKPKATTLRTSGFAAVTALSLSVCNQAGTIAAITAIEKGNNRARLWTLAGQYSPKPANVTRRPLVAPGAEWRLTGVN